MFDEKKCKVCESMFLSSAIGEDGRCKVCRDAGLVAGMKDETEYIKSEKQNRDELKALVREVLEEIKEEDLIDKNAKIFEPRNCKKCGAEFIPMTANNKYCRECKS